MIAADHITFNDDGTAWLVVHGGLGVDLFDSFDRPCDEPACDDGWWYDKDDDPQCKCEECYGTGRHTFDIEVENPHCAAAWPEHSVGEYNPACCRFPKSCSAFPITYPASVVPGMVLPIYDTCPNWEPADHICKHLGQWTLHRNESHEPNTESAIASFPPAAAPGMWAVQLKVAS